MPSSDSGVSPSARRSTSDSGGSQHVRSREASTENERVDSLRGDRAERSTGSGSEDRTQGSGTGGGSSGAVTEGEPNTPSVEPKLSAWGFVRRKLIFMWPGIILSSLDGTVLVALSARISEDLKGASKNLTWINSGYFLAQAICQPLLGRLTNKYGREQGLIVCGLIFAAGNVVSGLSKEYGGSDLGWILMIVGRLVSGIGGGGLTAIPAFITADQKFQRHKNLRSFLNPMIFGFGTAIGGVFGGGIDKRWGWKWAFHSQAGLMVPALGWVLFFYWRHGHELKKPDQLYPPDIGSGHRFKDFSLFKMDFLGAICLAGFITLFIVGLNEAIVLNNFQDRRAAIPFGLSFLFLPLFLAAERFHGDVAIMPLRLFNKPRCILFITVFFCNVSFIIPNFFIPIYLQSLGKSPFTVGAMISVAAVANAFGSIFTSIYENRLNRFQGKRTHRLSGLGLGYNGIQTLFMMALIFLKLDWSPWFAIVFYSLVYFGAGGSIGITGVLLTRSLPTKDGAIAMAVNYAFRASAIAIGVAGATMIFQHIHGTESVTISKTSEYAIRMVFLFATLTSAASWLGFLGLTYCEFSPPKEANPFFPAEERVVRERNNPDRPRSNILLRTPRRIMALGRRRHLRRLQRHELQ